MPVTRTSEINRKSLQIVQTRHIMNMAMSEQARHIGIYGNHDGEHMNRMTKHD